MKHSIEQLLDFDGAIREQYDAAIDPRIEDLYGRVAHELIQIWQAETRYLEKRSPLLKEMCDYLEADARCLLSTEHFHNFVKKLVEVCQTSSRAARPTPVVLLETNDWLLNRLEKPVQIYEYRMIMDQLPSFCLTARLGDWHQTFAVAIARFNVMSREINFLAVEEQWAEIVGQMKNIISQEPEQETQLSQEVSCLLCFAGLILDQIPKMRWFTYP